MAVFVAHELSNGTQLVETYSGPDLEANSLPRAVEIYPDRATVLAASASSEYAGCDPVLDELVVAESDFSVNKLAQVLGSHREEIEGEWDA